MSNPHVGNVVARPSPEVLTALMEMRTSLESVRRFSGDSRERVWAAYGHLRDALYREAEGRAGKLVEYLPDEPLVSVPRPFSDSPIVISARAE